ncbi:MAG: hypothetical protein ACFCGT_28010 [Sandaracinaceae bacterium]
MDEVEQVKSALAAHGPKQRGRKVPVPIREQVVALMRRLCASGATRTTVAERLEVSLESLRRWERAMSPAVVPVEVVAASSRSAGLVVTSPSGFRVEGLDVETAAALLRRLG